MSPLANAYVEPERMNAPETFYPLHVWVCDRCFLVQLEEFASPQTMFSSDYAYFSSYSDSWLAHCRAYVEMIAGRLGLDGTTKVVELASNDGYLLQYFKERGIPVLGVEPAANVAQVAIEHGIPTTVAFFGEATARRLRADGVCPRLLLGNNVLAHVPNVNDFVRGTALLLADDGVITMEFPHLMRLMELNQFDTIYHEHFSYFSFITVDSIFRRHGLVVFDVEEIPTHGGSLRIYARHARGDGNRIEPRAAALRTREEESGFGHLEHYLTFGPRAERTKWALLEYLIDARRRGERIVGYGAAAKGNTLLNYCGIRTDLIDYVVDRSPRKQGRYLPGTHIPIHSPERIRETRPDAILILPWNVKDEVMCQIAHVREWGARFVVPIPEVAVHP